MRGELSVRDGLARLLADTGLTSVFDEASSTFAISRDERPVPASAPSNPAESGTPGIIEGRVQNASTGEYLERARLQIDGKQMLTLPAGLSAPHYDGRGIEPAPDGRLAYWTVHGLLRHAAPGRAHYQNSGRLFGFGLDSERAQCRWGRVMVEACIPHGTALQLHAFSADEADAADPLPGAPHSTEAPAHRTRQSPRPRQVPAAEGFAWFDAPVPAGPGRFLWLVFEFTGTRSKSPRLRQVQVEYPGHGLLQQLPRTLWRDEASRDFLFRLLMPVTAMLDDAVCEITVMRLIGHVDLELDRRADGWHMHGTAEVETVTSQVERCTSPLLQAMSGNIKNILEILLNSNVMSEHARRKDVLPASFPVDCDVQVLITRQPDNCTAAVEAMLPLR